MPLLARFRSSYLIPAWICFFIAVIAPVTVAAEKLSPKQQQFFENKIRPVLAKHCYSCHSRDSKELKGGLQLDTRMGIRKGGDSGHGVVPNDVDESLIISAMKYEDFEMPPSGKLPEDVIGDFVRWIKIGAPDPREGNVVDPVASTTKKEELWSLKPVTDPTPPNVADKEWPGADVDRFILAKQESNNIQHVGDANRLTLLRRLYFDLVGLPPTTAEIDDFVEDASDTAIENVVDRLLQSPHFGERWGRHWLDVVRYGESAGNSRDVLMLYAWRYRDYVIDAFNSDLPYDQFVREQIAGDLMTSPSPEEARRRTIATGLLAIGSKSLNGGNLTLDIPDDQIDVVSKSILGLTVSCARCHDHKFDPIPTADYYALAGIFRSTETLYGGSTKRPKNTADRMKVYLPLSSTDPSELKKMQAAQKAIATVEAKRVAATRRIAALRKRLPKDWKQQKEVLSKVQGKLEPAQRKLAGQIKLYETTIPLEAKLKAEVKTLRDSTPQIEYALGVRDAKKIQDWPIQIRGDGKQNGDVVARGFLSCVNVETTPKINEGTSGRLALADWITQPDHPLTARVYVNRVWQHLFGNGLVRSVDNFGVNGTPPTHPQLLDYLAYRFVRTHQWSTKKLIRELVLTRTYQLSSGFDELAYEEDAENEMLWRFNRRRMEAEPLRDFMLAVSGSLDPNPLEGSLVMTIGEGEVGRNIDISCLSEPFPHRSVYLPVIRGIVPESLRVFDLPEPSNVQGQRDVTNVPAQSLYLMNSPFVIEQSEALAKAILASGNDDEERVAMLYQRILTRPPTDVEATRTLKYVREACTNDSDDEAELFAWTTLCQAMFARADFRYID